MGTLSLAAEAVHPPLKVAGVWGPLFVSRKVWDMGGSPVRVTQGGGGLGGPVRITQGVGHGGLPCSCHAKWRGSCMFPSFAR